MKILETRDVHFSYPGGTEALRGVSLGLSVGRKVALVGPNGAGKSTLMLMWNGVLRPTSGEVRFKEGALSYDSASLKRLRRNVGIVFQNPDDQLFAPTVYQDVAFGPVNLGLSRDEVDHQVSDALSYMGLEGFERRPPHQLSGGEKKRIAIAGILAMRPEVVILDEPTSNIDPASSEEIMEMLDEQNVQGKTIVISTHDVELAYRWADEVVLMDAGRVIRQGTPEILFSDEDQMRQARIKPPVLLDLYHEMVGRGLVEDGRTPPEGIPGMIDLLEEVIGTKAKHHQGRIFIVDVDRPSGNLLRRLIEGLAVNYIGAMGTRAKMLAEKEGIDLDFTYGVIDKSILRASNGETCLIMTTGGMVDHAALRIEAYVRESRSSIKVEQLDG